MCMEGNQFNQVMEGEEDKKDKDKEVVRQEQKVGQKPRENPHGGTVSGWIFYPLSFMVCSLFLVLYPPDYLITYYFALISFIHSKHSTSVNCPVTEVRLVDTLYSVLLYLQHLY